MDDSDKKPSLISLDSFVEGLSITPVSGKQIDNEMQQFAYQLTKNKLRIETIIEFVTYKPTLWLMLASDASDTILEFDRAIAIAHYEGDEDVAYHRFYCLRLNMLDPESFQIVISKMGPNMLLLNEDNMRQKYSDTAVLARCELWLRKQEALTKEATMIAEGRLKNTAVDKARILYGRENGCIMCTEPATGYVGSTFGGPSAVLYLANTCDAHKQFAEQHPSILHFLLTVFKTGFDLGEIIMRPDIPAEIIPAISEVVADSLKPCESPVVTRDGDTHTLKFRRPSGFTVILRLKHLLDYAYIIQRPDETEYRKIDSKNHHRSRLSFSPDHLHLDPGGDNKNVISSFTYGNPILDLPIIKRLLEDGEREETYKRPRV